MTSLIEKRQSLHRSLAVRQQQNHALTSQLMRLQPLANIGSASSMIAHEINNLLTPLGTYADLALHHLDDPALIEKALRKAVLNCQRASKVMESMLAMANGEKQTEEVCEVSQLFDEVFTCLCRDFSKDGIVVNLDTPGSLPVSVVSIQIQQVFMNLMLNAREAMLEKGGTLSICARRETNDVVVEIRDNGHGIAPENLERIFQSFFSTKNSNDSTTECCGTGLGLAFCQTVIDAHAGSI
ncbi:sensor histidine kinase, partial [Planctomycetota bacterium]